MAVVAVVAQQAFSAQRRAVEQIDARFENRTELATSYVEAHLDDMRLRQLNYARLHLAGPVSSDAFDAAVSSFGFTAAVLLDDQGRALAVSPQKPSLLGTEVASQYRHLSAALAGEDAVSDVVLSAAERRPIVAVAVPFDTANGRRIISGGYDLTASPLASFLASTSALPGRQVYLVDQNDAIVAATEMVVSRSLSEHAPELAAARPGLRTVDRNRVDHVVVAKPVPGTTWRLIAAVPASALHATADQNSPWLPVLASAVMALLVLALLRHTSRQRDQLDKTSRIDALTQIANRLEAERILERAAARSDRSGRPWAVASVDVDHFKAVNDEHGHLAGDRALRHVATVLADACRTTDVVARWGGEEFLVIMEDTNDADALTAAERLVDAVRNANAPTETRLTISVGTASAVTADVDSVLNVADDALYRAKATGRNRAAAGVPSDLGSLTDAQPGTASRQG